MVIAKADKRTNDRQLVGQPRQSRKELAESESRDARRNGAELAANLTRRIWLEIKRIKVRRPPGQKHHDHATDRAAGSRCLGSENLG
jgi:hypothetical protein